MRCSRWAIARIWRWLAARWPVLARPRVTAAAAAPVVLLLAFSGQRLAYRHALPMTWEVAQSHLTESLQPMAGRLAYYERGLRRLVLRSRRVKGFTVATQRLDQIPPGLLDRADAELFPEHRLAGAGGDFYRRRLAAAAPREVVRIHPVPFRLWGPSLVMLVHPWRQVGRPIDLALAPPGSSPMQRAVRLPSLAPRELGSLELVLPKTWEGQGVRSVFLGGKPLALARFTPQTMVTTRFDAVEARAPLRIRLERPVLSDDEQVRARLYRWQR